MAGYHFWLMLAIIASLGKTQLHRGMMGLFLAIAFITFAVDAVGP